MQWCKSYPWDNWPAYFKYELGINDGNELYKQYIDEGYFELGPFEDYIRNLKVAELKELLLTLNLSTTGKKDDLINRILNVSNKDKQTLQKFNNLYVLSKKGEDWLEEHKGYIEFYNNRHNSNMSLREFLKTISNPSNASENYEALLESNAKDIRWVKNYHHLISKELGYYKIIKIVHLKIFERN